MLSRFRNAFSYNPTASDGLAAAACLSNCTVSTKILFVAALSSATAQATPTQTQNTIRAVRENIGYLLYICTWAIIVFNPLRIGWASWKPHLTLTVCRAL